MQTFCCLTSVIVEAHLAFYNDAKGVVLPLKGPNGGDGMPVMTDFFHFIICKKLPVVSGDVVLHLLLYGVNELCTVEFGHDLVESEIVLVSKQGHIR